RSLDYHVSEAMLNAINIWWDSQCFESLVTIKPICTQFSGVIFNRFSARFGFESTTYTIVLWIFISNKAGYGITICLDNKPRSKVLCFCGLIESQKDKAQHYSCSFSEHES